MATLSSASCRSYAAQLPSSSSPTSVSQAPICGHSQRMTLSSDPQRFLSSKISCQLNRRRCHRNAVSVQDGSLPPSLSHCTIFTRSTRFHEAYLSLVWILPTCALDWWSNVGYGSTTELSFLLLSLLTNSCQIWLYLKDWIFWRFSISFTH